MMKSVLRLTLLAVFLCILPQVAFARPNSSSQSKVKVGRQLEAVQQSFMDIQNALRTYQETGQCPACPRELAELSRLLDELAWFFAATRPALYTDHLLPDVARMQRWLDNPDEVPQIHQLVGDLMTRSAYDFLLLQDIVWDAAFWEKAESAWPAMKATLTWPKSRMKRADRAFDAAMRTRS